MLSFSNNSSRTQRSERRTAANRSARALLTGTVTLGSLAVTLALPSVAQSESLWDRHIPEKSYLFYDTKARYVGDRVTIKLNDKLVVDNTVLENFWERDKPLYPTGQIELQNHGNTLFFRNIYIRELSKDDE